VVCHAVLSGSGSAALPLEKEEVIPPIGIAVPKPTEGDKAPVDVLPSGGREVKFHCATISACTTRAGYNNATPMIEVPFIAAHPRLWV
jgi:hypothetical protein